jgi:hypothetical protein
LGNKLLSPASLRGEEEIGEDREEEEFEVELELEMEEEVVDNREGTGLEQGVVGQSEGWELEVVMLDVLQWQGGLEPGGQED